MTGENLQTKQDDRDAAESGTPSVPAAITDTPESKAAEADVERTSREWRRFYETVREITQGLRD